MFDVIRLEKIRGELSLYKSDCDSGDQQICDALIVGIDKKLEMLESDD